MTHYDDAFDIAVNQSSNLQANRIKKINGNANAAGIIISYSRYDKVKTIKLQIHVNRRKAENLSIFYISVVRNELENLTFFF